MPPISIDVVVAVAVESIGIPPISIVLVVLAVVVMFIPAIPVLVAVAVGLGVFLASTPLTITQWRMPDISIDEVVVVFKRASGMYGRRGSIRPETSRAKQAVVVIIIEKCILEFRGRESERYQENTVRAV
jgi:hypothetical protein